VKSSYVPPHLRGVGGGGGVQENRDINVRPSNRRLVYQSLPPHINPGSQ